MYGLQAGFEVRIISSSNKAQTFAILPLVLPLAVKSIPTVISQLQT